MSDSLEQARNLVHNARQTAVLTTRADVIDTLILAVRYECLQEMQGALDQMRATFYPEVP